FEVMNGMIDINEGALSEEFVAAELSKKGINLHYYDKKSKHELDFLIATSSGIEVIEVKSGDDYKTHASLDYALENEGWRIAKSIVLCKSNTFVEDEITYMPLYMAMFL
ncbi:MAG: DUF4143 domain-containing protein, partial [Bacteroidales bacterium]|nr:DUF4143 domain-containing protein [Bacteroidales bacterium]